MKFGAVLATKRLVIIICLMGQKNDFNKIVLKCEIKDFVEDFAQVNSIIVDF